MIFGCVFRNSELKFHTESVDSNNNIFTTIVGRNGSGKSRLLRELVNNYANVVEPRRERDLEEFRSLAEVYGQRPSNVIASSTSPFDKFPIRSSLDEDDGYYHYQGLRGLTNNNLSLAFMSRTLGQLIKALTYDSGKVGTVMGVLDYLGYHEFILARFVLDAPRELLDSIVVADDPFSALISYANSNRYFVSSSHTVSRGRRQLPIGSVTPELAHALKYFMVEFEKPRVDVAINSVGAIDVISGRLLTNEFSVLMDAGLLRLRDVSLHKKNFDTGFRISDASSGEQCVVMALMGIAAHITDGSLICIDEPEICLHPEWQERYIELLMSTFSGFKACHFIIATHSPQIISKLADRNCYVLDMQTGKTFDAKDFNRRSADFQLANVFGAPGYKNEYLTREILNALSILGSGRELSADRVRVLTGIVKFKAVLDETDPVMHLLDLLEGALEAKANG